MQKFVMPRFIGNHRATRRSLAAAALAGSLLLGGCGLLPPGLGGPAPDQALFQKGVDSLDVTTSPDAFSRLATEFPDSPWTSRAKAIEKALGRAKEERRDRNPLQKRLEDCLVEKEKQASEVRPSDEYRKKLDECLVEKEKLASEVRPLDEYRKKLDECRVEKARLASDLSSLERYTLSLKSLLTEAGIAEPVPPSR